MKPTANIATFETLETRTLMSGTVIAKESGGNLLITGDPNDNNIVVTKADTTVTVTAGDGDTIINEVGDLTNITGTITIRMVDGDDTVEVGADGDQFLVQAPATHPSFRDFLVDMGAGDDDLTIWALGAKNVSIIGGLGNNTTEIDGSDDGAVISGTLTVTGGAGDDSLTIGGNVVVTKAATITNGAGTNDTEFDDDGSAAPVFAKTLTVTGGVDSDTVTIAAGSAANGLLVGSATALNMGAGNNELNMDALTTGNFTYVGGTGDDAINPGDSADYLKSRKAVTLTMGAGTNSVYLDDVTASAGNLTYTGSTTGDDIEIDGTLRVRGLVSLNVGAGTNSADIDSMTVSGAVTYVGGTGTDSFTVTNEAHVSGAVTATMGVGQNTFELDSAVLDSNLTFTGGANVDHVTLNYVVVSGITKISTLAGDDDVTISDGSNFLGTVMIDTNLGDDTVDIASGGGLGSDPTNFFDAATILAGGGNDTVTIGDSRTSGNAVHFFDLLTKFDGGPGLNDVLAYTDVLFSFNPTVVPGTFETAPA